MLQQRVGANRRGASLQWIADRHDEASAQAGVLVEIEVTHYYR
jgi:hypothetical protein